MMPDREKVIKGLESCMKWTGEPNTATCHCSDCSYTNMDIFGQRCLIDLINDALELLKEQDAEWVYGEDETGVDGWHCSECNFFEPWFYEFDDNIDFIKRYEHCPKCGRRMISYTGKQEGR